MELVCGSDGFAKRCSRHVPAFLCLGVPVIVRLSQLQGLISNDVDGKSNICKQGNIVQLQRPSNWNMAKLTTYNIVIGMIVAIGTFGYGYGFGVFITSIGQPGFYRDFNLDRKWAGGSKGSKVLTDEAAKSKYTAK
jgi:hypothetical protein